MKGLNIEREEAKNEYMKERQRIDIDLDLLKIRQDGQRARSEQADIEEINRETAKKKAQKEGATYRSPLSPGVDDVTVGDQQYNPLNYKNTYQEQVEDMELPLGFGGKRKTRKYKKSNKRKTDNSKKKTFKKKGKTLT